MKIDMNKKGFTLIELMIVVAIIAILAMIAVPMYQRYIERSRNTAAQSVLHQVAQAMTAFNVDTSEYLPTATITSQNDIMNALVRYGFRADPNVGVQVATMPAGVDGFVAYAAHKADGSRLYVYDNVNGGGVLAMGNNSDGILDLATGKASTNKTAVALTGTLNVWATDTTAPTTKVTAGTPATVTINGDGIVANP